MMEKGEDVFSRGARPARCSRVAGAGPTGSPGDWLRWETFWNRRISRRATAQCAPAKCDAKGENEQVKSRDYWRAGGVSPWIIS